MDLKTTRQTDDNVVILPGAVVGMGAILLNHARVGRNCIVGAGAVVTGKMDVPDGSMVLGNPARVARPLTQAEIDGLRESAEHYMELKEAYR